MRKLLFFTILFLIFLLANCATDNKVMHSTIPQEKCDTPIWNIGDYWKFVRKDLKWWEYRVIGIENDFYIVKNPFSVDMLGYDKKNFEIKVYIDPHGNKRRFMDPTIYYFNFPIYVGKEWARTETIKNIEGIPLNYLIEFKVISYEEIKVRAGTFKAFKIEHKVTSIYHMSGGKAYVWFSPEVKNTIKVIYEKTSFWLQYEDYELMSFKLRTPQKIVEKNKPQALQQMKLISPPPGMICWWIHQQQKD